MTDHAAVTASFEAEYRGGEIINGEYIKSHTWIDLKTAKLKDYLEGGWLRGVEQYIRKLFFERSI